MMKKSSFTCIVGGGTETDEDRDPPRPPRSEVGRKEDAPPSIAKDDGNKDAYDDMSPESLRAELRRARKMRSSQSTVGSGIDIPHS